jgi:hypothetical protein
LTPPEPRTRWARVRGEPFIVGPLELAGQQLARVELVKAQLPLARVVQDDVPLGRGRPGACQDYRARPAVL